MQGEVPHDAVVQVDDRADQNIQETEDEGEDVAVRRHHRVDHAHQRTEGRQQQHERLHARLLQLQGRRNDQRHHHPRNEEQVERQVEFLFAVRCHGERLIHG